jgi:subtilase family serine protease
MRRVRLLLLVVSAAAIALLAVSGAAAAPFRPAVANVPFVAISEAAAKAAKQTPVCPNGLVCYSPSHLKQAYDFPNDRKSTGAGQTILIVEAYGSPSIEQDLAQFDAENGLPDPPSFTIVGQQTPTDGQGSGDLLTWAIETSLDVEYAHAMAPGADIVLAVANSDDSPDLTQIVKEVLPKYPTAIVSQSFGQDETGDCNDPEGTAAMQKVFLSQILRGGTVVASSGDYGASNFIGLLCPPPLVPMASFPASSPYVLAVGGTMGDPAPAGLWDRGRYGGEQVWNEQIPAVPLGAGASGGAPSVVFKAPFWQLGITRQSMRAEPDVAYNAAFDGGVVVVLMSKHGVVGGTSAGAPQWAAIVALANEQRLRRGGTPLGIATPFLYAVARDGNDYRQDFHDIVKGSNALFGGAFGFPGFQAAPGYDLPTGLGTPVVSRLIKDLASRELLRFRVDNLDDGRGNGKGRRHVRLRPGG